MSQWDDAEAAFYSNVIPSFLGKGNKKISTETHVVRGVAHWAKVIGAPRFNEYSGGKEWSIDVTPNAEGRALLKRLGISSKLREPKETDERKETFLSFRHKELKNDGSKADPIRIVDATNAPWDGRLIGNGSVIEAKFVVKDYGKGKPKGTYLRAIRVLELVPYVPQDFAPLDSDDEFFAAPTEQPPEPEIARLPEGLEPEVDDLDDDVPM